LRLVRRGPVTRLVRRRRGGIRVRAASRRRWRHHVRRGALRRHVRVLHGHRRHWRPVLRCVRPRCRRCKRPRIKARERQHTRKGLARRRLLLRLLRQRRRRSLHLAVHGPPTRLSRLMRMVGCACCGVWRWSVGARSLGRFFRSERSGLRATYSAAVLRPVCLRVVDYANRRGCSVVPRRRGLLAAATTAVQAALETRLPGMPREQAVGGRHSVSLRNRGSPGTCGTGRS
jgi:hypothetical protein